MSSDLFDPFSRRRREERQSWYDTAQVCLNGHSVNSMTISAPELSAKFCDRCGQPTITQCASCSQDIRGHYHVPGVYSGFPYHAPKHCHACGAAYPWTERALQAARDLAIELAVFDEEEMKLFNESLDEIVHDTPQATVAAHRLKKLLAKTLPEMKQGIRQFLVDVTSETVKKIIWPTTP